MATLDEMKTGQHVIVNLPDKGENCLVEVQPRKQGEMVPMDPQPEGADPKKPKMVNGPPATQRFVLHGSHAAILPLETTVFGPINVA